MTSAMSSGSNNRQQIVQIVSVDPTTHTAVGMTRQQQPLTINTRYLVGAVHYTPGIDEQWFVRQVGTVTWALDRKLPKNTNDLLNVADNPVPGQVQIGSSGVVSGPLIFQGSQIFAKAPLGLVSAPATALPDPVAAGAGALIWNTTTHQVMFSNGTNWYAVGTGGGGGGPVIWSDIEDIPDTFPSDWSDISSIPTHFPTTWGDVSGKPATFPPTLPTGTGGANYYWNWDGTWKQPSTGAGAVQLSIDNVPVGTINGSNPTFTLPQFTLGTTMVYLNGVRQRQAADYTETNDTTIAFVMPPESGDTLVADFVVAGNSLVPGEVPTPVPNGTNAIFTTANSYATASTSVFRNGIREQINVGYTESGGNTIVFSTPPRSDDVVVVDYLLPA